MMGVYDLLKQNLMVKATHANYGQDYSQEAVKRLVTMKNIEILRSRLVEILMDQINDVPCRFNCFAQDYSTKIRLK